MWGLSLNRSSFWKSLFVILLWIASSVDSQRRQTDYDVDCFVPRKDKIRHYEIRVPIQYLVLIGIPKIGGNYNR